MFIPAPLLRKSPLRVHLLCRTDEIRSHAEKTGGERPYSDSLLQMQHCGSTSCYDCSTTQPRNTENNRFLGTQGLVFLAHFLRIPPLCSDEMHKGQQHVRQPRLLNHRSLLKRTGILISGVAATSLAGSTSDRQTIEPSQPTDRKPQLSHPWRIGTNGNVGHA